MTIDTLPQLEAESWDSAMRYSRGQVLQRLSVPPPVVFVLKIRGVGIICLQRINDVTWISEDKLHDVDGSVLQLRRVNTWLKSKPTAIARDPVGSVLRDFCLHHAHELALGIVCGVTRPTGSGGQKSIGLALDEFAAHSTDADLQFYLSRHAMLSKTANGWRPADEVNIGFGVLMEYGVQQVSPGCCFPFEFIWVT